MPKQAQSIRIKITGQPVFQENMPHMVKMGKGGFCFNKPCPDNASRCVVYGESEYLELITRPPLMRRTVMLEEVTVSFALPSSPGLRTAFRRFSQQCPHVPGHMVAHVRDRPLKAKTPLQLIPYKAIVRLFINFENLPHELDDFGRPLLAVGAPRNTRRKPTAICQPPGSQIVELGTAYVEAGCRILPCE